jgi:hypothetical protein
MSIFNMVLSLMFQGVFPCFLGLGGGQYLGQAKQNETADQTAVGQYGSNAGAESAQLNPFFSSEMKARHGFDPTQTNEMLTAAEAGAGGATGGATGMLMNNAARTGNATGVTKSLDEMARDRSKAAAGASEGIAAADVAGAKQLNQQGAAGLSGLYGTNVSGQLGAMKQADEGIKTEQATQGQNWLQQLDSIAKFGGDVAGGISGGVVASDRLAGR